MSALVHYDAARQALIQARSVDEVQEITSRAEAMRAYARQARDRDLEINAAEIRIRAERCLGFLIKAQKSEIGLNPGGRPPKTGSDEEPVSALPTLAEAGIDRKLSARAQQLADLPEDLFGNLVTDWREQLVATQDRVTVTLLKREARARMGEGLAEVPLPVGKWNVIYADPPWRYETWSEAGLDRAADNHYQTMTVEEIKALEVPALAADDCSLFLWATVPMLPHALEVMTAWGFVYKSHAVWVKDRAGNGYWFRNRHELLLLGTRGNPPTPEDVPGSVIDAARRAHSEKPAEARELVRAMTPGRKRIELFSRHARPGWDRWGKEAPGGGEP